MEYCLSSENIFMVSFCPLAYIFSMVVVDGVYKTKNLLWMDDDDDIYIYVGFGLFFFSPKFPYLHIHTHAHMQSGLAI